MTDPTAPRPEPAPMDDDPVTDDAAEAAPTPVLPSSRGESVAAAVGSFMAGIEQQVFQRRPPAVELVRESTPVRGLTGDGLEVTLELPDLDGPER